MHYFNLLLFGSHAVIVKPVDDGLGADAEFGGQSLQCRLVRIRVLLESLAQGGLLLLGEEHPRLLLRRRRLHLTASVAQLVIRPGRRTLHSRCNNDTKSFARGRSGGPECTFFMADVLSRTVLRIIITYNWEFTRYDRRTDWSA